MKQSPIQMRSKLLKEFMEKDSSQQFQVEILNHIASIPEEQREAEAERVFQMMNRMSEKEVSANL